MTVSTSDNREEYVGNDSTTVFGYTFKIFAAADLEVYLVEDGAQTLQTLNADYTVSGVGEEVGGDVTMTTAPTSSQELVILRVIAVTQETDLRNQGAYYPETIEDELDRSRMIDQQQQDELNRSLKKPEGGDHFDAVSARIENLADAVNIGDAVNLDVLQKKISGIESGEIGDATLVTASGTTDERALADWTKALGYPTTSTGTDQPLDEALDARSAIQSANITVNIPTDYATLQAAIDDLSDLRPAQGVVITINIETAHSPASGIIVRNGDYSHFKITSTDAEVTVAAGFGQSAAFIRGENARMPTLDCLVNGNAGEMGYGYYVKDNSSGYVTAGSGAKACWQDGLAVKFGAYCYAPNTVFTGNAVNGATSSNIHVLGGLCHAQGADASGSNYYGAQASSGGILVLRGGNVNNAVRYGLRARDGGVLDADTVTANDCGVEGVRAFISGRVNFRNGQASRAGQAGISASRGSTVAADGVQILDSLGYGINATSGSSVDADVSTITGAANSGIRASGARVSCFNTTISNNARGIEALGGASVQADSATTNGNTASGVSCLGASNVSFRNGTSNTNDTGITCDGGFIDVQSANCESNTTRGIYALRGGKIAAHAALCQKTPGTDTGGSNADITCLQGGIISASSAVGGTNKTVNALNGDGIIFQ